MNFTCNKIVDSLREWAIGFDRMNFELLPRSNRIADDGHERAHEKDSKLRKATGGECVTLHVDFLLIASAISYR